MKWEYLVQELVSVTAWELEATLNDYGSEGWETVSLKSKRMGKPKNAPAYYDALLVMKRLEREFTVIGEDETVVSSMKASLKYTPYPLASVSGADSGEATGKLFADLAKSFAATLNGDGHHER